jgi:hypothetical protein
MASEPKPSSTTIPASASPEIQPPPPPSRSNLQILRKIDRTIHRLAALLSNPASTDALLGTTSYALTLLHAILSRLIARRLLQEKTQHARGSLYTSLIANLLPSMKVLVGVIDDHRIFVRLWGLLGLYTWSRVLYATLRSANAATTPTRKERFLRTLAWVQIASLVTFQVLENGAYLASKRVLVGSGWEGEGGRQWEARWWMWSCRGWGVFVALELVRLAVQRYSLSEEEESQADVLADGEKEGKLMLEERAKARRERSRDWRRDLISNVGYMPLTAHYSVEGGFLPDWAFGILGVAGAGALLVDAWAKTAQ